MFPERAGVALLGNHALDVQRSHALIVVHANYSRIRGTFGHR